MIKTLLIAAILPLSISFNFAETLGGYRTKTNEQCGGFPKVSITTMNGSCLGLVASEKDGLIRPRRIIELPDGDFIITDMVRWGKDKGIVWRLSPYSSTKKLTKIFTKVDHAHGLALGPDGLVYVGTRSTIFRFDPHRPHATREIVISDLPGDGKHPMSHFIFDQDDNLIVNVGAPSDQCEDTNGTIVFPCQETQHEALLRRYLRTSRGQYPRFEVIARGLRNSMALAVHPQTHDLFQGENNMDFKELDLPEEEINLIDSNGHYGWPYCYANGQLNPNYRKYANRIRCNKTKVPVALLPAHSAPLDMLFYQGSMFPELEGKLVISLHGYRETGHRIVTLNMDESSLPLEKSRQEIVTGWQAREGLNPKGSPVGMAVARDGSIWFVEDKNKTVMVLTKGQGVHSSDSDHRVQVAPLTSTQKVALTKINRNILSKRCTSCHGQLDQGLEELHRELITSGWVQAGNAHNSPLYKRVVSSNSGRQMPLTGRKLTASEVKAIKNYIDSL